MQEDKAAFAKRVKAAMEAKGWPPKPAVLERKFNERHWGDGVGLHGVRRWLRGETLPRQDHLVTLAEVLDVPPHVLRYGPAAQAPQATEPKPRWGEDLGWSERELMLAFLRLPVPQRRVVRDMIKALTAANEAGKASGT